MIEEVWNGGIIYLPCMRSSKGFIGKHLKRTRAFPIEQICGGFPAVVRDDPVGIQITINKLVEFTACKLAYR
ncbi:hypothetical protein NBRC116589_17610 [Ruegeria sp. HU-ET01832]